MRASEGFRPTDPGRALSSSWLSLSWLSWSSRWSSGPQQRPPERLGTKARARIRARARVLSCSCSTPNVGDGTGRLLGWEADRRRNAERPQWRRVGFVFYRKRARLHFDFTDALVQHLVPRDPQDPDCVLGIRDLVGGQGSSGALRGPWIQLPAGGRRWGRSRRNGAPSTAPQAHPWPAAGAAWCAREAACAGVCA